MGKINYRNEYEILVRSAGYSWVTADRLKKVLVKQGHSSQLSGVGVVHPTILSDVECKRVVLAYYPHLKKKPKRKSKGR